MPLYVVNHGDKTRLISAKSPAGAKNYVLRDVASAITVKGASPMEAAELAFKGVGIEHSTAQQEKGGDEIVTTVESAGKQVPVTVHTDTGYVDDSGVMDPRVEATMPQTDYEAGVEARPVDKSTTAEDTSDALPWEEGTADAVPVSHDMYNEELREENDHA